MTFGHYFRIWLASARYAMVRTMMYRFDFFLWSAVEFAWMMVNLLLVEVMYRHTSSIAGWNKFEMLLLVGTSMIVQRLFTGFFWTNLFEVGRNVRLGNFDFYLAQPGNPLFMVSTRKLDPDGLVNSFVGMAVVLYATRQLGLQPDFWNLALYAVMVVCGVVIHYAVMVLIVALSFWLINSQGIEGSYFTIFQFSRLPREAFRGATKVLFVWLLPAVVVSYVPASQLLHGYAWRPALWLVGIAGFWLTIAVLLFNSGLRRYSSASS